MMSVLFGRIVNAVHQIFLKDIYAEGVKIKERYCLTPSRIWGLIVLNVDVGEKMIAKGINIYHAQNVKLGQLSRLGYKTMKKYQIIYAEGVK